jgi:hypothetical protein
VPEDVGRDQLGPVSGELLPTDRKHDELGSRQ